MSVLFSAKSLFQQVKLQNEKEYIENHGKD